MLALLLGSWLLVSTTAFYADLSSFWRGVLFYTFIVINGSLLIGWILIPFLRQRAILKRMSYRIAANMIGDHFPEVRDKLLNTIDLYEQRTDLAASDLLLASIEQRTQQLQPIPFQLMIDFGKNRKYLRVVLPVVALFLFILFAAPGIIREGGERVIRYQTYFEPIAPFDFMVETAGLVGEQGDDLEVKIKTLGSEIPLDAYLEMDERAYRMESTKKGSFAYVLRNVQQSGKIRFKASKYYSPWYSVKVVPKPVVDRFEVQLHYPKYLNKADERLSNTGDLLVPEGTLVQWRFSSSAVDDLRMLLSNGENLEVKSPRSSVYESKWRAKEAVTYHVQIKNTQNPRPDSLVFGIQVIPDAWPVIVASEAMDSVQRTLRYFSGEIGDDYGFSFLRFVYQKYDAEGKADGDAVSEALIIGKFSRQQFYHFFDIGQLGLRDGAFVEYYFEVADNDGVNGPKKVRSEAFSYKSLTARETKAAITENASEVENQLKAAVNDARKIQQEMEKLRRKLREQKELSWDDKRTLERLRQQQEQLQEKLEEAGSKMQENRELRNEQDSKQEELMRKQQQLQEMAERLLNDEIKKTMEELQKMMEQQANQEQLKQKLDQMQLDQRDVEKELDRMLEFFKQMEVEQKAMEVADKLDELAKKQESLRKETNQPNSDPQTLEQKQQQLNDTFDELKEDIEDLEKKNESLERPNDLGDLEEEAKEISDKIDQAKESLQKNDKKNAGKQQQEGSAKMQQMAKRMREQMQQQEMETLEENIQALRMLLENLIKFSFNQEDLMDRLRENSNYSPVYVEIGQDQFKLKSEAKLIEDSLMALAKRIIQLQSTVIKEMGLVNDNLEKAVDHLGNRQTPQAKTRQQYVMTSVNNLAVLLSELLKSMQEQMAQKMNGEQQCQKPGSGSQSKMSKMSQMQKSLNEQMQRMKESMEGQKGEKPGGKDGQGREMSQGFAEMVAKQEAIRRELQKMSQEMNKDGKGSMGDLDQLAKEMEKTEKELVNKVLTRESMKRQQDIMTRLLEAEKAEREREFSEERESNTAKEVQRTTPPGFEAYRRQKLKSLEMYRTMSPELNSFYKRKVDDYFLNLNP